jgi:DNA-binding NarL/FixJ family response regulator
MTQAPESTASRIGGRTGFGEDVLVRVLIVDDYARFRATARRLLESEGYEVVGEAENAAAALAVAKETLPELVLLDVQLPDLDGFELAERLVALDSQVQVVLISSRDVADYGRDVEASSARGFLPKSELSGAALAGLLSE